MADITVIDPARHYQRQSTRRSVVVSATVAYVFVSSSANIPGYIKTTDGGVTWSAHTAVTGAGGAGPFDIYYAKWTSSALSNIVLLAWLPTPSANPGILNFAVLNLDTDTFTTPTTEVTGGIQGTFNYSGLSCCISRSGDYWVTGTTGFAFAPEAQESVTKRSTDDGANWTTTVDIGEVWRDEIMLWPDFSSADTDDILGIFCDNSATEISVKQLDVSANTVTETSIRTATAVIGDGQTDPVIWSSTLSAAGVVYLVVMSAQTASAVTLATYTVSGVTVTAKTDVITATTYVSGPYIARDALGTVRVFYGRDPEAVSRESQAFYYKESTDTMATWGAETQISDGTGYWISSGIGDPMPSGVVLPVWWDETSLYATTDSPIVVGSPLVGTLPMTFTLTGTLTGGVSAAPPVVIKCKPISATNVVNFSTRTIR